MKKSAYRQRDMESWKGGFVFTAAMSPCTTLYIPEREMMEKRSPNVKFVHHLHYLILTVQTLN